MTENTIITIIGGLIGFVVAVFALLLINHYQFLLEANEVLEINPSLFMYGFILIFIFSLLSGAYPAYRMSSFQITTSLNDSKQ